MVVVALLSIDLVESGDLVSVVLVVNCIIFLPMGDMINVSCVDRLEKLEDELMEVVEVMGGGGDPTVVEGVVTCSHFSASSLIPPPPLLPALAAGDLFALRDLLVAL